MNKTLMPEIAKMLGVEMGENFKMKTNDCTFFITISGLHRVGEEKGINIKYENEILFLELLKGNIEIVKLPFEPKEGEEYWFWLYAPSVGEIYASADWWKDNPNNETRINYMLGNCYRTEAECEADTAMKERIEKMERCKW